MRIVAIVACLLSSTAVSAQEARPGEVGGRSVQPQEQRLPDPRSANIRVDGAIVEPRRLPPRLDVLRVPDGYRINMFAQDLGNARMIAVADDGTVYVTRRNEGDVQMLRDMDGDGRAEVRRTVARRPGMHGIAIDGRTVFLVTQRDVYTAAIAADGSFGRLERIIDDLPDTGQHPNRTIAVGPDGMLYISIGSTCNACMEQSPESATIVRASRDGRSRTIFASGLRNTIGFDWHPRTGTLWGLDHGIDWLGDTQQQEEMNRVEQGRHYGWPYIYGNGGQNPQDDPPGELTMDEWDRMSTRPLLGTDAHAAPMQMQFYRGSMFPVAEQGNAFAAFRGSWNRAEPSGYDIRRIRHDASGTPVAVEPFVTGFLQPTRGGWGQHGRLAGLAVARDGALLVSDDANGVIYRVSYHGRARRGAPLARPRFGPQPLEPRPAGEALALARTETRTRAQLVVSSSAFRANGMIPMEHSAYDQDISPALAWRSAPAGTRSFALLMEDPDAGQGKPFVHWVAWNLPPTMDGLPEGVPTLPQLPALGMARQGRNTRGSIGYFGPRPPIGDRPHRYHFQLFALDTTLDLLPGASREELLAAMRGHVLASGEVVGTFRQATPPTR